VRGWLCAGPVDVSAVNSLGAKLEKRKLLRRLYEAKEEALAKAIRLLDIAGHTAACNAGAPEGDS
jgi:hypothetical protein